MIFRCECRDGCGTRLQLGEKEYASLAELGVVVSKWCVEGRRVIARCRDARAVETSRAVFVATSKR